jgi:hypothetical protein
MLTVKTWQQPQLTMPPYKPEEKDQFHEFAEAPPPPASVAAGSAAVAGSSIGRASPTAAAAVCAPMTPLLTSSS